MCCRFTGTRTDHVLSIDIIFTDRKGKVMFPQVSVCPYISLTATRSLLGLVRARSVCNLLECFLVVKPFIYDYKNI